jgi:ResB-like family
LHAAATFLLNPDLPPPPPDDSHPARRPRNRVDRVLAVLGSFNIAVVAFALMIVVTFAGTWLQKTKGLYDCQRWYFESWITPREGWIGGWLPLPGMALLLAVIFVNVLAGGIIRIRKSPSTVGVIIAHLSMLGFIIAGAVSLWSKTEGFLLVNESARNSVVEATQDWVIEVRELGKSGSDTSAPGNGEVFFFPDKKFRDCVDGRTRTFFKSVWPFEIKVSGYLRNAAVVPAADPSIHSGSPRHGDYALKALEVESANERNLAGVKVEAVEANGGATCAVGLLSAGVRQPMVFECAGRRYSMALTRERWELPFAVHLDDFRAKYYPGTKKAESYESDIRVVHANGKESKHHISMNQPLRDSGYVAFQTNYDQESPPGEEKYSVFTVVKNRSDQWPLYSLIVCTMGLVIHFLVKLSGFLRRSAAAAAVKAPSLS